MPTAQQPATGTDWIGMLSNSNLFKFAGEFSRMFPGYGAITGAAVDLVGGVSDWRSATAAGVSGNTRAVIAARDILSGIDGIVGHIDYCAQIAHAIAVPVPPAEALILPFNEFTTTVKTGVDGAVLVMDVVEDVMLATDKAGVTPDSVAAKKSLNAGAAGNTIQDGVSMIFDIVDACTGGADQSQAIQKGVKVAAAGEKLTKVFVSSAKGVLNAWLSMLTNKGASAVQRDAEPPGGADAGDLAMKAGKSLMVGAVSTELSTMETAYGICGQLMESSIDNYHNTLKGIDAAMTLANGGKNPAIRIAELSGEMQKEFDARSHTLQEVIAKTGTAQDKLASIDAFVADLRKTADKCVVPHFEPAKPPANESVLDEAVRLAKNAAMEVANTGLGELQSSASLAQAGLRRVADDLASERQKIATFLQSVQDAAKQEVADIQARLDIITKRMTKAKSFEEFAEALVDEAAKALGLADGFKPEDIKALYDELGPLFPQVRQVLAAAAA